MTSNIGAKLVNIVLILIAFGDIRDYVAAFSSTSKHTRLVMSTSLPKPEGCAKIPFEKKKVAVFGAGGYLGATVFGFLQRASSIYGTGLGGVISPRCIGATATASDALNRVLNRTFKLAFAGEDLVRLTNMQDPDAIRQRLKGMDAVIIGTVYQLEKRPVTANSYEKTPNDKTLEFYLDDRYLVDADIGNNDMDIHLPLFRNTIEACKAAEMKHVLVFETPGTIDARPFAEILDEVNVPFTYIKAGGPLENAKYYTFEEGIQDNLDVQGITFTKNDMSGDTYEPGGLMEFVLKDTKNSEEGNRILREDIAALMVQSLMTLDWSTSRYLKVYSRGKLKKSNVEVKGDVYIPTRATKSDRYWCMRSEVLAETLASIK